MPQFTQILKISTISKAQAPYSGPDGKMLRVYCGLAVGRAAEDTRWGHEAIVTPHSAGLSFLIPKMGKREENNSGRELDAFPGLSI